MKGYLIIFFAAGIALAALAFSFSLTPVSDAPTADAAHITVECDVTGGESEGETATKTCTVEFRSFCKVYVITWTEQQGDQTLNTLSELRSLNITREPCP